MRKHLLFGVLYTFFVLLCVFEAHSQRNIDGSQNNLQNPNWGKSGTQFKRYSGRAFYADGISVPRSGPNTRLISNRVFYNPAAGQPDSVLGLTDFTTYWGQFLDHDITLTLTTSGEAFNIAIPLCDNPLDLNCLGNQSIPLMRSLWDPASGTSSANPRQHFNNVTSFIDGSQVYGSDTARAAALRTFVGGELKTSAGNFAPINTQSLLMQTIPGVGMNSLYLFGDIRGNENPGLMALQTLFLREHNRQALRIRTANPTWNDEQIYQEARKWVIAFLQHITINEYAPVILGAPLPPYSGYNSSLDPSIATEFSTGAFRYGHSEVNEYFYRLDNNRSHIPEGDLHLRSSYFSTTALSAGLDPLLIGMATQIQKEVDTIFVDDLRNYLFGPPGAGGMDLIAINTQRARDHGIPSFNEARLMYGLPAKNSWAEISSDSQVQAGLNLAYGGNISLCELYVCGLAEDHLNGSNVGETFEAIIREQYNRLRHADRFWYENPGLFNASELNEIRATNLADVILRNTNISSLQCFVMSKPDSCVRGIPTQITTAHQGPLYDFILDVAIKSPSHPFYNLGTNAYAFTVNGREYANLTLVRGRTYTFQNNANSQHSLFLSRSPTGISNGLNICSPPYVTGCFVNSGDVMTFTPPMTDSGFSATLLVPATLSYACSEHEYMGGIINLVNPPPLVTTGALTTGLQTTALQTTSEVTTGEVTTQIITQTTDFAAVALASPLSVSISFLFSFIFLLIVL